MAKTRNPGWRAGSNWVYCDVCGFIYRQEKIRLRWDGLAVCPKDFELRQPQDFVRGRREEIRAKGLIRVEPEDEFI